MFRLQGQVPEMQVIGGTAAELHCCIEMQQKSSTRALGSSTVRHTEQQGSSSQAQAVSGTCCSYALFHYAKELSPAVVKMSFSIQ
jgi:hypothetical protein